MLMIVNSSNTYLGAVCQVLTWRLYRSLEPVSQHGKIKWDLDQIDKRLVMFLGSQKD